MSPSASSPLNDRLLRELATEPPKPLFPALRQAEAMAPLVIVLAFLPTLYALAHRTVTEAGARQGLMSLNCLAAKNLAEFIDPAVNGPPSSLVYQPLLMNWFTALALNVFGVGHVAGYLASAYLCTAGLIMSAYVFGRRLGGDRLGLLAALLLAFNPHVLKLAQEPVPQSAAALFAVLALAGAVAHWQKSSSLASIQLLLGGIALGLCLLAGGPVAIAVVLILMTYATWWKIDGWRRIPTEPGFDRSQLGRSMAVRSVLILSLTGFAVGGWRALLMGSRYGADFWQSWLGFRLMPSTGLVPPPTGVGFKQLILQGNYLVLPLSILSLVGAGVILGELLRRTEDPGRRHRGLLIVWIVVATGLWIVRAAGGSAAAPVTEFWTIMLIVPLSMSAAVGLLAVIDRRIPFAGVVAIALVTCLNVAWIVSRGNEPRALYELAVDRSDLWVLVSSVAVIAAAVATSLLWPSLSIETRRRGILVGIVLGAIAANCIWGGVAVRRSNSGDRELEDLRAGLARVASVTRWTLVVPVQPALVAPQPPAQLIYLLRSLWPSVVMTRVDSWESLAAELSAEPPGGSREQHLIVTWSPYGRVRPTVPAGLLKAAAPPCLYRDHEVAGFFPGESSP
jgi:4-amino-4-deoxy-L-arabinose transferase-like glycosyltransferase